MSTSRLRLLSAAAEVPHPVLRDRKSIVAGTLIARSFDATLVPHAPTDHDVLHDMRTEAAAAAVSRASCRDHNTTLEHHLDAVRGALGRAVVGHGLAGERGPVVGSREATVPGILARFDTDLARIDCIRCGRANGHLCNGSELDNATMRKQPECWSPFTDIFALAMTAAQDAYQAYVPDLPAFSGLPSTYVAFTTTACDGSAIDARTMFPPRDGLPARYAEVVVDIPRGLQDPEAYHRLAYLLFHEVIVHAVQAARRASARKPQGSQCAFAEGLVDSAAFRILMHALDGRGDAPIASMHGIAGLSDRFRASAHGQREERCRLGAVGSDGAGELAARARAFGRRCFDKLSDVRGGKEGERWAIRLALCLNLEDLDLARRRALLMAIWEGVDAPSFLSRIGACRALDAYLEHADVDRLRAELGAA
ncbi:hypothetical protein ACFZ8E_03965 [Methylobacterium sp. HMF5984]|uniref:hypothetical protein n=1 Tax=Methylobacterium sp. HMF5984 TaxID=3367370 RepID=UPI0038547426